MNTRQLKPLLIRVSLLLVSFLATLLIAEGFARLTWHEPTPRRPLLPGNLPVLKSIRDFSQPNTKGQHRGVFYRINSHGLRGGEISLDKPPRTRRIAIVGDSFTMGWGVKEEDTYVAQLEKLLGESQGESGWEVLNLGLAGLSIDPIVDRLQAKSAIFKPDLLVYGFTINDIEGPDFVKKSGDSGSVFARTTQHSNSSSYLLRYFWPKYVSLEERISPTSGSRVSEIRFNYLENEAAWVAFVGELERMRRLASRSRSCAMVLLHTQLTSLGFLHPYTDIYDAVAKAAEEHDLVVVRTFDRHRGRNATDLWVDAIDSHPNREGHRILAESLRDSILTLPESCWSDDA